MTVPELPGRRARWIALLSVAPGAAAVFGASTSWALHTVPGSAAKPAVPASTQTPGAAVADSVWAMQQAAKRDATELRTLEAQLARLRRQLAAVTAGAAPATAPPPGGGNGTGGSIAGGAGSGANTAPGAGPQTAIAPAQPQPSATAPVVVQQPTQQTPPPVSTTTGASGGGG